MSLKIKGGNMAKSRIKSHVDLLSDADLEKADAPQYHVKYLIKKYPFTSRLFTPKERADIVVKKMKTADMLAEVQKHKGASRPPLFESGNPYTYWDEDSFNKLCAGKKPSSGAK